MSEAHCRYSSLCRTLLLFNRRTFHSRWSTRDDLLPVDASRLLALLIWLNISCCLLDLILESCFGLSFSCLLENPVVLEVIFESHSQHYVLEQFLHVIIVWLLFKLEVASVRKILVEFFGQSTCECFDCCLSFLLLNAVVFFIFVFSWETLPRQLAFEEVDKYESDALHVITSGLFNS